MSGPAQLRYAVVVPTVGRDTLSRLLDSLAAQTVEPAGWAPAEVFVIDDRPETPSPLTPSVPTSAGWTPRVICSGGRGPAAARNVGWRLSRSPWVVFLDDDVELPADWSAKLAVDLADAGDDVGGSQGRVVVPQAPSRRPTDWERNTAGLQLASWATADMAYRRAALQAVDGFDERFPRAYREDADLALRVRRAGWQLTKGRRCIVHPVRPADDWVSVRVQTGNADDALMRRLHGASWRQAAQVPAGRLKLHGLTVAAGALALAAATVRRRRLAALAGLSWAGLSLDFGWRRISAGPRPGESGHAAEIRRMALTSPLIPPAAVAARLRGEWRHRRGAAPWPLPVRAVLFDRDGTLVHDVPYNGDPDQVRVVDDAAEAVATLRRAGVKLGVITNQSGVGRGLFSPADVRAVNERVEAELGHFDTWQICPHAPEDGCGCRKPSPQLVLRAARDLGVPVQQCAVVGDIGSDMQAARNAGARPVLVPTAATRPEEIADAPAVADRLAAAVELLLGVGQARVGARP